jgi:hypothetical protein
MDSADPKAAKQVTLGDEVAIALIFGIQSDQGESPTHQLARVKLGQRLRECSKCVVSEAEVTLITDRAHQLSEDPRQIISSWVYTQMVKILDPVAYKKADL